MRSQQRRSTARLAISGEDINAWMVRQGWALAYRHYSTAYVGEEDAAHAASDGIWRGTFEPPWQWRQDHGKKQLAGQHRRRRVAHQG